MEDKVKSGRPVAGEYAAYAERDIREVAGDDAVSALLSQSRVVLDLVQQLGEEAIRGLTYAPGKWTLKEVIGHLIDDERIFSYRALCVARNDRRELSSFDENEYIAATDFERRTVASLAAEYRAVRDASIAFFQSLTPEEWLRRGFVNEYMASVRGLAFHIAGHELHHLRLIREKYLGSATAARLLRHR